MIRAITRVNRAVSIEGEAANGVVIIATEDGYRAAMLDGAHYVEGDTVLDALTNLGAHLLEQTRDTADVIAALQERVAEVRRG